MKKFISLGVIICLASTVSIQSIANSVQSFNNSIKNRVPYLAKNITLQETRDLCYKLDVYNKFTVKDGLFFKWKDNQAIIYAQSYWITAEQDKEVDKFAYNWTKENWNDNQYEMVVKIKDFIINHVKYDEDAESYYRYSSYGAMNGLAVCQGYTLLAQKFFDQAGIDNELVLDKKHNHSYNKVYLDSKEYKIDLTRDDKLNNTYPSLYEALNRLFIANSKL